MMREEITLELNADVAEWCPLTPHRRLLAAGTYQLNEDTQQREGRIYLYLMKGEVEKNSSLRLEPLLSHSVPGILDLRWLPYCYGPDPILIAALADGSLRAFTVETNKESNTTSIIDIGSSGPVDGDMALSVGCGALHDPLITDQNVVSSYSSGALAVHHVTPTGPICIRKWQAHDLEAWSASWDVWSRWLVYSGGDDSAFKAWDVRQDHRSPVWVNRKSHKAGVCCTESSPKQQYTVCTGSYDEIARLWDCRNGAQQPISVSDVGTGGGVWRLKWHPVDACLLLGACMHGGFTILEADAGQGAISVAERYDFQQTLAYGAGWCAEVGRDGTSVAATCSFYDRLLHLWVPKTVARV